MALTWDPLALPSLAALLMAWGLAAAIYFAAPGRRANRFLALVLTFEGLLIGSSQADRLLTGVDDLAMDGVFVFAHNLVPGLYLGFLGTLDTAVTRPLAGRRGLMVAGLVSALGIAGWFLESREIFITFAVAYLLVPIYGLAAAILVWRRTPKAAASRRRATAYMAAFGTRDLLYLVVLFPGTALIPDATAHLYWVWAPAAILFIYLPILAYGILSTQLLEIDLRLKWTVRHGTLTAAFFATFFVASEAATAFFTEQVGTYVGILVAGALVFALAPLQRLADRVASAAVPGVAPTSEYLAYRKLQVYRAAAEEMHADGTVTEKERTALTRLARELGIRPEDAEALEREVASASRA